MNRMYVVQLDELPEKIINAESKDGAIKTYLTTVVNDLGAARYDREKRAALKVKARKLTGLYI